MFLCVPFIKSNALHVVAREGAEESRPLARPDVPPVVALFQDADRFTFLEFQFILVLRQVVVQGSVPSSKPPKFYHKVSHVLFFFFKMERTERAPWNGCRSLGCWICKAARYCCWVGTVAAAGPSGSSWAAI